MIPVMIVIRWRAGRIVSGSVLRLLRRIEGVKEGRLQEGVWFEDVVTSWPVAVDRSGKFGRSVVRTLCIENSSLLQFPLLVDNYS